MITEEAKASSKEDIAVLTDNFAQIKDGNGNLINLNLKCDLGVPLLA